MNFNAISLTKNVLEPLGNDAEFQQQTLPHRSQTLKLAIQSRFTNVIVSETHGIMHIQYLGPAFEQGERRQLQLIRDTQGRGKNINRNQTVSVDIETLTIMHQFGPKPITFGAWESTSAPSIIYHELLRFQRLDENKVFKVLHMPIGLQVQVCWLQRTDADSQFFGGKWVIASRSFSYINETVIGNITVWSAFAELLSQSDVQIEALDKNRLYTFLIQHPKFLSSDAECQDYKGQLYLMSVFDRVVKSAVSEDAIKRSKMPRLQSKRFTVSELFSTGRFITVMKNQYARVNTQSHMYSLILLAPDNTYYEIETQAADSLRSDNMFRDFLRPAHNNRNIN